MPRKFSLLSPVRHTKNERIFGFFIIAAAAGLIFYLFVYNSYTHVINTPPCMFRTLTGLYCPGCGTRSALIQLAGGNLYAAFRLNPLTVLALPMIFLFTVSQALTAFTGRSLARLHLHPALIWGLFILIVAYWIMRNIPAYPFTLLQPVIIRLILWGIYLYTGATGPHGG
ncbi:MAG: DUF2752 domain-containing protein [Bacillota bacterium]